MRKLCCILFSIFILLCCGCKCTTRQNIIIDPATIGTPIVELSLGNILKAVNVIVWHPDRPVCGGTVIRSDNSNTLVLTALHCVLADDESVLPYGFVSFQDDNRYRVVVHAIDRNQDLALLRVTDKISAKISTTVSEDNPVEMQGVWIVGFGAGVEDIISHGTIAKAGTYSVHTPETHCILIDGSAYYGNSGGGIFDIYGRLVGVLIQIGPNYPAQGLWSYGVHTENIRKFVTENAK